MNDEREGGSTIAPTAAHWRESVSATPDPSHHSSHTLLATLPPEGRRCLEESLPHPMTDGVYCNASWDSLYCWPATQAGTTVRESCATIFSDVPDLLHHPQALAHRECDASGQWLLGGWTNYSQCLSVIEHQVEASSGVVEAVRYITFIGALLSLLTLTIAIFIFTYFRTLECDRLRVHRNLVLSLIVRFLVMLVLTEPFVSNRQNLTYRDVDWLCKSLLALRMYAQMASINWMFVEGLFLHSRLTSNVFDSEAPFALYYVIGWGWPLVFLSGWAATMSLYYPVHCWRSYGNLPYIWILVAPMVTALMINLLFLVNIIRILVTKLRASDAYVRKAIKATAVLFPLLGITNLLFAVNPGDKGDLEDAYMLTNALLQSSQGVSVSVLYCFLNAEVRDLLRKRWQQYRLQQWHSGRGRSTRSTAALKPAALPFDLQAPGSRSRSSQLLLSDLATSSQLVSPMTTSPQLLISETSSPETHALQLPSPEASSLQLLSSATSVLQLPSPETRMIQLPSPDTTGLLKPNPHLLCPRVLNSLLHSITPQIPRERSPSKHFPGPSVLGLQPPDGHLPGDHSPTEHDLMASSM